jgi:hypothetical protein
MSYTNSGYGAAPPLMRQPVKTVRRVNAPKVCVLTFTDFAYARGVTNEQYPGKTVSAFLAAAQPRLRDVIAREIGIEYQEIGLELMVGAAVSRDVVFVKEFSSEDKSTRDGFEKIVHSLEAIQRLSVVKCPVQVRGDHPVNNVDSTDILIAAEVVSRVANVVAGHPSRPDLVVPLLFLGGNRFAPFFNLLSKMQYVKPILLGARQSTGADLLAAADSRFIALDTLFDENEGFGQNNAQSRGRAFM